jgi:hypothetical protein
MLNRLRMPLGLTQAIALVAALMPGTMAVAEPGEYTDLATRHLVKSVQSQRDGSHLTRLSSLRELRDPGMAPLFYDLLQHEEWQVQVHALLGLAEIDEAEGLEPWLVTQIDPLAREQVIPNALDMNLLTVDGMKKLIEWDRLEASHQVMLLAELMQHGEPIDVELLRSLLDNNDLNIASVAGLLLAEQGDAAALSGVDARLKQSSKSERTNVLQLMINMIRLYELESAADWLDDTLREADTPLQSQGTFTLLTIDPERGRIHWKRNLGDMPAYRQRVLAALQLLEAGLPVNAEDRRLINADEDEVIDQLARTANAVASGENVTNSMIELIDTGHPRGTAWAIRHSQTLPDDEARIVHLHFLDRLEANQQVSRALIAREQGIAAMANLIKIDPATAAERLLSAEDESLTQQTLLLGCLQSPSVDMQNASVEIRRIGSSRADSLALLLLARSSNELSEQDVIQLGRIAAGGGMLGEMLQIQAAWLYLKHRDELDGALMDVAAAD